jgi:hypothetical protein
VSTQAVRDEAWPVWAKVLLIAIAALAILVAVPWIFMWTSMAATCAPMMNAMNQMMGPGMMR